MAKPLPAAGLVLVALVAVSGCTVATTPYEVPEFRKAEVLSYATPALEGMMAGINAGDYGIFSARLSRDLRENLTTEEFGRLVSSTRVTTGKYVSRDEAVKVEDIGASYRATYTALFTDDYPVTVALTFKKDDGEHYVEGFRLSSKKLTGLS